MAAAPRFGIVDAERLVVDVCRAVDQHVDSAVGMFFRYTDEQIALYDLRIGVFFKLFDDLCDDVVVKLAIVTVHGVCFGQSER